MDPEPTENTAAASDEEAKQSEGEKSEHEEDMRSEEHSLNSSHDQISYAVFCLKKKNKY